jgi:hypothetical protein
LTSTVVLASLWLIDLQKLAIPSGRVLPAF